MYKAKIFSKEKQANGNLEIVVEFSNGTEVLYEKIQPQDRHGFNHWIKSRLTSLNSLPELEALAVDEIIDGQTSEPTDTRTAPEVTRDEWLSKYYKWVQIKKNLIDTGILTRNEELVKDFLADVKDGFKPDYINFI